MSQHDQAGAGNNMITKFMLLPSKTRITLIAEFFMNTATFIAFPLITILLLKDAHLSPESTGIVVTGFLLSARLLQIISGLVADKIGAETSMVLGALLRAGGFIGLTQVITPLFLLAFTILAGAGGALFDPAANAVLSRTNDNMRAYAFAVENIFLNMGVLIGPVLGGILASISLHYTFLISAVVFIVVAIIIHLNKNRSTPTIEKPSSLKPKNNHVITIFKNNKFLVLFVSIIPWWILFAQLNLSIPVFIEQSYSIRYVGIIFTVKGLVGILIMLLLSKWKTTAYFTLLGIGYLGVGVGYGLLSIHIHAIFWQMLCIAIYSIGETLILYYSQLLIADIAHHSETPATYFGLFSSTWAIGGTIGNTIGSYYLPNITQSLPWIMYFLIGITAAIIIFITQMCVYTTRKRRRNYTKNSIV